ncbi:hypothetical protein ACFXPT_37800 [Streptomyces goshikiensis]|uniref:hypothetical protein n=1 Tax=Streptomyces goshikiensis TaxID=1942 RepID=UPI0036BAA2E3
MNHSQYQPGRNSELTTEQLLASLIPDTPATLTPTASAAGAEVPSVAALLELARAQGVLQARLDANDAARTAAPLLPVPAAPAELRPIVPRWAVGAAVAGLGIGGGVLLLGVAVDMLAAGAAALAAGAAAALPFLIVGGVIVAAMVGRRKGGGRLEITQTMTSTMTQTIKGGRR